MIKSKNKTPAIEKVQVRTDNESEELQVDRKLVQFFEILMQIDQRQRRNGKNN